jgi:hypothetical protein
MGKLKEQLLDHYPRPSLSVPESYNDDPSPDTQDTENRKTTSPALVSSDSTNR